MLAALANKTAVTTVFVGKERVFNRRFLVMADHYEASRRKGVPFRRRSGVPFARRLTGVHSSIVTLNSFQGPFRPTHRRLW
jgi:hypothetical protein